MRTSKLLAAVAAVAVSAAALTACSSDTPSTGDSPGKPVEISFGVWAGTQTPVMQQIVDAFNAENPDITVKIQEQPWPQYWSTLQVGMTGGTAPDAFWMLAQQMRPYAEAGMLIDLNDAIEAAGVDVNNWPAAVRDTYDMGDGAVYGLPKDLDTNAIWFNKDLFDAAGVAYPDDTWTWETFRDAATKLTTDDTWGVASEINGQSGFYNTVYSAGGRVISEDGSKAAINSPEAVEGLQFWIDLQKDGSSPTLQQLSDLEASSQFEQGRVAMYMGGSFWAPQFHANEALRDKVGIAPIPEGPQGRVTMTSGISVVGNANSDHKDAVTKFVLFAAGEKAAKLQGESGAVIPAYTGTQQSYVDAFPEWDLQVFIDAIDYSAAIPVYGNTAEWQDQATQYLAPAWDGKISAQEAADNWAKAIDDVLANS